MGKRQYESLSSSLMSSTLWLMRRLIVILLYDNYKMARMWFYLNAVSEGIMGRFDNQKPKQLLMRGTKSESELENTK